MIAHSNRSNAATACQGAEGDECNYTCDAGYLAIGRHVCQSYSVAGLLMINQSFSGGRCVKLCGSSPASWSCKPGLVPVRVNISGADSLPCLSTSCYTPMEALTKLTRGNWEVWKLGRNNRTGMYIDHVNPLVPKAAQQEGMASTDGAGPGLAMECVAAALGYQSKEEAASRVLVTLQSLTNRTAGFFIPRNEFGWLPTFINTDNGACLVSPTSSVGCEFSTDSTAFNTAGVLFAKTFFEREMPGSASTLQISALGRELFDAVQWSLLFCSGSSMQPPYRDHVQATGTLVPWLYNSSNGCRLSFAPAPDGLYYYSEMHWLAWLAYEHQCRGGNSGRNCSGPTPVHHLYRAWQDRASAPNYWYSGQALLTLWPSYVLQLPFYLVHAFNSDPRFVSLFRAQWQAEWAYYNSSSLHAGERGRYGLGAGPTAHWCAGTGYLADKISNDSTSQTCRMYSPYAVAGYLPADPGGDVITEHLLHLLAAGEAVLPVVGTEGLVVLWRKSMLDPGWQPVPAGTQWPGRDPGYGITLVDFAAEMFGLSTLWLDAGFFRNNTNHWSR